jgi:hypothetical protein
MRWRVQSECCDWDFFLTLVRHVPMHIDDAVREIFWLLTTRPERFIPLLMRVLSAPSALG